MKIRTEDVKDYLKKIDDANIEINKVINNTRKSNDEFIKDCENKIAEDREVIIPVDVDNFLNTYKCSSGILRIKIWFFLRKPAPRSSGGRHR